MITQIRTKLILIFLLTAGAIGIIFFLPESLIDEMALPFFLGTMYPHAAGKFPETTIDTILHLIILVTPAIGYAIVISLSSALAYLFGVLIHLSFKRIVKQKEYF